MNSIPNDLASGKSQISVDEALQTLRAGLTGVDAERAQAYGQLAIFRAAKQGLLARHEKLLARKLGENDPRVVALQVQRTAIDGQLRDLRAAQAQTAISIPEVKPDGYALYGFVRTIQREPIPRTVVAIYDINGRKRTDFDSSATDDNGYFEAITSELVRLVDARIQSGEEQKKITLDVRIFDQSGRPLEHLLPSIDAVPGQVDFREILADTSSQAAAMSPDTVPKGPTTPRPAPRRDAREKLNIIADELRRRPQGSSVGPTILAARQKFNKAKGEKQRKRPKASKRQRRSKKGKAQ